MEILKRSGNINGMSIETNLNFIKTRLIVFVVYFLLSFPSFYFVYKFGDPTIVAHDFFQYYRLYNNWDWADVNAPFNMRLISTFFVFLFNKLGLVYNTETVFDKYVAYGFDKGVYFNAILFNCLCVAATSTVIFQTIKKHLKDNLLAIASGMIYLLGFGTLFFELMPCTDAFSILLFATVWYAYLIKSQWIYLLLIAAIFQREYILMVMPLIALVDYFKTRDTYFVIVLLTGTISFLCFFWLRSTLFYTPALSFQTQPKALFYALTHSTFPIVPFIKQTLMTLNIFILYLFIIFYKWKNNMKFNSGAFVKFMLLFVQLIVVSFAAVLGNNAGRYFYILIPFVIFELAGEAQSLLIKPESQSHLDN